MIYGTAEPHNGIEKFKLEVADGDKKDTVWAYNVMFDMDGSVVVNTFAEHYKIGFNAVVTFNGQEYPQDSSENRMKFYDDMSFAFVRALQEKYKLKKPDVAANSEK